MPSQDLATSRSAWRRSRAMPTEESASAAADRRISGNDGELARAVLEGVLADEDAENARGGEVGDGALVAGFHALFVERRDTGSLAGSRSTRVLNAS